MQVQAASDTQISLEAVFTANHSTDADKQNITRKYTNWTLLKKAKQNYPGSVASYNTRPGNETGLFNNASEPTGVK